MSNEPYLIGIAGDSGVGKSTIANIISMYLGPENTVRVSTDDLHKWERTSPNWRKFTHLNPVANNLELGDMQIIDLFFRKPVYRSVYNHVTGFFDPPTKIEAKKYIINEGLHAFYTDTMKAMTNIKIFVHTDEDLRKHWKIIRDTESRGYKYGSVMEEINKRKNDSTKVCGQQINDADVVVLLGAAEKINSLGYKNEDIILTVEFKYNNPEIKENKMFSFIKEFMLGLNDFIKISKILGHEIELCQDHDGNVSVKVSDSVMIIKASGYYMKDIHGLNGHSVVNYEIVRNRFDDGTIKDNLSIIKCIDEAVPLKLYNRPPMETCFHSYLGKYVIHTHPVYLNVILCLDRSKDIIKAIYSAFDFFYVDYKKPGFEICQCIANNPNKSIYFLENHGLIISMDSYLEAIHVSMTINSMARQYLSDNSADFTEFSLEFSNIDINKSLFYQDSVVLIDGDIGQKREILAVHNYISKIGRLFGKIRYLSQENVTFLQNIEDEI